MQPKLNTIYCYRSSEDVMHGSFKKLNARKQPLTYLEDGYKQTGEIIRYAKTVNMNDKSRTLLFITKEEDSKKVNAAIKKFAKSIESDENLLSVFIKAESTPLELELKYES